MKERAFEKALADWSAAIAMLPPRADSAAPLLTPADTPASVLPPEDRESLLKEWVAEAEAGRAVHPTLALSMHGMFLHLRGNYAEAMACYDYVLHLSPSLVDVLLKRASLWFEKEDLTSALADFETALRAEPQSADVYCHRGQLRILQNELSAALDDLRKAVDLDPDSVLAHIQLGMALHRSSQPTQARSAIAQHARSIRRIHAKSPNPYGRCRRARSSRRPRRSSPSRRTCSTTTASCSSRRATSTALGPSSPARAEMPTRCR